jgi:hypothetical protein
MQFNAIHANSMQIHTISSDTGRAQGVVNQWLAINEQRSDVQFPADFENLFPGRKSSKMNS